MENFLSDIRRARMERRLTQAELARQLGVTPAFVSKPERGVVIESERIASRCAELLGVSRAPDSAPAPRQAVEQTSLTFAMTEEPAEGGLPKGLEQSP